MLIPNHNRIKQAFTLVELLVSLALLVVLMLILVSMVNQTRSVWQYTASKTEQFRDARNAFETVTRRLSQATLNTYWDYQRDKSGNPLTTGTNTYTRQSELRFISGPAQGASNLGLTGTNPTHAVFFLAPLGWGSNTQLENLLNTAGYYIEWVDEATDPNLPPHIASYWSAKGIHRCRYRLMEMIEPSQDLSIYQYTSGTSSGGVPNSVAYVTNPPLQGLNYLLPSGASPAAGTGREWYTNPALLPVTKRPAHVVAENVVALVILPKLSPQDQAAGKSGNGSTPYSDGSLAPNYSYDSTTVNSTDGNLNPHNQLPPVVQVTVVAVDEPTFNRLQGNSTSEPSPSLTSGLFQIVGSTTDSTQSGFAQDLNTLQTNLQSLHLNYRIFTTNVSIKAAKWSRSQTN